MNMPELKKFLSSKEFKLTIIFIVFIGLAIMIRIIPIFYRSGDYTSFLTHWWRYIDTNTIFEAYGKKFSDYSPLYLYLMGLMTYITNVDIIGIKILTYFFEFLAATAIFGLVRLRHPDKLAIQLLAFFTVLFAPTVLLNGAFWGQCDIIYTTFCIASLYFLIQNKGFWAFFSFAIAFAFKLQSIFFFPILIIWLLYNWKKVYYVLLVPIVYIITCIPAALQGRSWPDLLTIYGQQSSQYPRLSLSLPNLWYLFDAGPFQDSTQTVSFSFFQGTWTNGTIMSYLGLVFAFAFVSLIVGAIWLYLPKLTATNYLQISLILALGIPFLLPKMHERYYFLADILAIAFAFFVPRKFWIALLTTFVSAIAYFPFLFNGQLDFPQNNNSNSPFDFTYLSLLMFGLIVYLCYDLITKIIENGNRKTVPVKFSLN